MGTPSLQITHGRNEAPRPRCGRRRPVRGKRQPQRVTRRVGIRRRQCQRPARYPPRDSEDCRPAAFRCGQRHTLRAQTTKQIRTVLAGVRTLVNDTDAVIVSAKPLMTNIDQTVSNVSGRSTRCVEPLTRFASRSSTILKALATTRSRIPVVRSPASRGGANQRGRFSPRLMRALRTASENRGR